MSKWTDDRFKALETEVAKLRADLDKLLAERQVRMQVHVDSIRSQIGLPR